jgi:hypothetical protein
VRAQLLVLHLQQRMRGLPGQETPRRACG